MRRRLAEGLAVLLSVASLGPEPHPGKQLEAAKVTQPPVIETGRHKTRKSNSSKSKGYQIGTASWYGEQFQGKQTASGEPFDSELLRPLTQASLGTFVRVTNLEERQGPLVVRINDRLVPLWTAIIDVSSSAAHALGFKDRGVQTVRLDLYQPTTWRLLQPPVGNLN